jgi:putative DNA-invertase from lambdoid prophage Rac
MAGKRVFPKTKSDHVFGQARRSAKMLRPGLYARVSTNDQRERTRAGLAHARDNGKRLGRPATAVLHASEIREMHRAGVSKSEIARRLRIGRTSVRRTLS